jgi:hypothetical protein
MRFALLAAFVVCLLLLPGPASACSLCGGYAAKFPFVTEYWNAHAVVCGTLANPQLNGNAGAGTTELRIDRVLRGETHFKGVPSVTLPQYLVILNPKEPPRCLALFNDKLAYYGGRLDYTPAFLDYLVASEAMRSKPRPQLLAHFAKYLDAADASVADDAFLLFAQANDKEVLEAAGSLKPDVFRKLVKDSNTDGERLSLCAFLLGATGTPADADLLLPLLQKPNERSNKAVEGILAGYMLRRPKEGWKWAYDALGDPRRSYLTRWGAVKAVRFLYTARPDVYRPQLVYAMGLMIPHRELADVAIGDLHKLKMWDHTRLILDQFGRPSHTAPIIRMAIVRYALACPQPEARQFVEQLRRKEPKLVRDLEEDLAFEQGK